MAAPITYNISTIGDALLDKTGAINKAVMPAMNKAVQLIAKATAAEWQGKVLKAKLWSGEKDAYAASIKWEMNGDLSAVVWSDYKYVQDIETGRPQRDLKAMLDTSLKVRRTKGGKRFLVIPFRHNTPGNDAHAQSMPAGVYAMAQAMAASTVTSSWRKRRTGEVTNLSPTTGMHPAAKQSGYLSRVDNKQAMTTKRFTYAWGGRLASGALKAAGMTAEERKRYSGMVRFDTSTPGGAKSSSFMTFRILMEGSRGWIVPAKPGLYLAKQTAETMQPKAQQAMAAAIKKMTGAA